jgi:hypothetical protein
VHTAAGPRLAVVLVTPDGIEGIVRTLAALRAQTARSQLELILVAPGIAPLDADDPRLEGFVAVQLVEAREMPSTGAAVAAGVRAATAPLVVCAEEHSYPEPDWAANLIEAHEGPWVAVGGGLANANPGTATSWAHLYSDFGPAVLPAPSGEAGELPSHHTSYRRDALLAYGDELDRMLEVEWVLQEDLRARGGRLYRQPDAVSWHLNVSRIGSAFRSEYLGGRSFGANRADLRGWSVARRWLYVAASPLLPAVRLARALRDLRRTNAGLVARVLPVLTLGLIANSAGQALGYALGPGGAARRRLDIELRRHRHVIERDREGLSAVPEGRAPRMIAPPATTPSG